MNSANLRDFHPDQQDIDAGSELGSSSYRQDIQTLKIDKLSNRVTIISIIIPCIIGAILLFAYLDMKERVVDVDLTKKSQFEQMSSQIEERINGMDVKVAQNKFELDKQLPAFEKKMVAVEGLIAKLNTEKADNHKTADQISKIRKQITNNANQGKKTLDLVERVKKQALAAAQKNKTAITTNQNSIKESRTRFDKTAEKIGSTVEQVELTAAQIREEASIYKEEVDLKLLELSDFEEQIAVLRKNVSLLDKKFNKLDMDYTTLNKLNKELDALNQRLTENISSIQKDVDKLHTSKAAPEKPKPQINIDPSGNAARIKQDTLAE